MVSPAGERAYQSAEHLASLVEEEPGQVQEMLDSLLKAGLHSTATYSLGHPMLTAEVQRWFDREEALNRCAQDTLDRAWADWYARERGPEQAQELSIGPNRLQEVAEWRWCGREGRDRGMPGRARGIPSARGHVAGPDGSKCICAGADGELLGRPHLC